MQSHLSPKKSLPLGKILGIVIIALGVLQILTLLKYELPPIPPEILLWGTAVGAILGGLRLLFNPMDRVQTHLGHMFGRH